MTFTFTVALFLVLAHVNWSLFLANFDFLSIVVFYHFPFVRVAGINFWWFAVVGALCLTITCHIYHVT